MEIATKTEKINTLQEIKRRVQLMRELYQRIERLHPRLKNEVWSKHIAYFNDIYLMVHNDIYDFDLMEWMLLTCQEDTMFQELCVLCNISFS